MAGEGAVWTEAVKTHRVAWQFVQAASVLNQKKKKRSPPGVFVGPPPNRQQRYLFRLLFLLQCFLGSQTPESSSLPLSKQNRFRMRWLVLSKCHCIPPLMLQGRDNNPIIHHMKLEECVSCTRPSCKRHAAPWTHSGLCALFLGNPSSAPLHNVTRLPAPNVNQTFHSRSQWRLAWQVGTLGDTQWILFCGFRLHKHHYHLADLELPRCSAPTPILSETLNGDAHSLPGTRAIESTKRNFS